jgi:hypothetical protein
MLNRIIVLPGSSFSQRVTSSGSQRITPREAQRCDDFVSELTEEVKMPAIIHEEQDYKPSEEEIVISWPDVLNQLLGRPDKPAGFASNCVLVGVTRNRALQEGETKGLGAVIDSASYSQWLINYSKAEAALYGLRKVHAAFGCEISRNPADVGNNYVRYVAPAGVSLPRFLGKYIRVLNREG